MRRVRVEAKEISQSPGSRRRRAIPKGQLQLALKGMVSHTNAYSFLHRHRPRPERGGAGVLAAAPSQLRLADRGGDRHQPDRHALGGQRLPGAAEEAKAAAGGILSEEQLAAVGQPHNTQPLRRWLSSAPARLVRGGRRLRLRLASGMLRKEEFWALHHHLLRLAPTE